MAYPTRGGSRNRSAEVRTQRNSPSGYARREIDPEKKWLSNEEFAERGYPASPEDRRVQLKDPLTTSDALEVLVRDWNGENRALVASHPAATMKALQYLWNEGRTDIRLIMLRSEFCSPEMLEWALISYDPLVRMAAIEHPKFPAHFVSLLLMDEKGEVREAAAARPSTAWTELQLLLSDGSVRRGAMRNPGSPAAEVLKLVLAEPVHVRRAVASKMPGVATAVLEELLKDEDDMVALGARNQLNARKQ